MITFEELLDTAKSLMDSDKESCARSSIHASYYALFHCANDYAESIGYQYDSNKKGGVHSQLAIFYEQSNDRSMQVIGVSLKTCKNLRVKADYYLNINLTKSEARTNLYNCNITIRDLHRVFGK